MIKTWQHRLNDADFHATREELMQSEIDELRVELEQANQLEIHRCDHIGILKNNCDEMALELATIKTKLAALEADLDKSIALLAMLFDRFENGVQCYEDPEDCTGFLGHAVNLTDDEFRECAEILNRLAPIAMKEANHD